jgi:hypothetical protein
MLKDGKKARERSDDADESGNEREDEFHHPQRFDIEAASLLLVDQLAEKSSAFRGKANFPVLIAFPYLGVTKRWEFNVKNLGSVKQSFEHQLLDRFVNNFLVRQIVLNVFFNLFLRSLHCDKLVVSLFRPTHGFSAATCKPPQVKHDGVDTILKS